MLAVIRKFTRSNSYKILLWLFLISMAFGGGISLINFGTPKHWAMKVYSETLSVRKFDLMLRAAKQQQAMFRQKGFILPNQNIQKETINGALGSLLVQHVIDNVAIKVPQERINYDIQQQLQQLPSYFFNENGSLNETAFKQLIAPQTIDEFVSEVGIEAKNKLFFGILDTTPYVSNFELILQYNNEFADKSYVYMELMQNKYLQRMKEEKVSDDVLYKFYKKPEIAETFKTPEKRAGIVWTFDAQYYIASISDSEVKQLYEKMKTSRYVLNPSQMQVRLLLISVEPGKESEAKMRIEELKQQADKDPSTFAALVKKFSDDKSARVRDGLTDFFDKNTTTLDKMVVDTAFEYLGEDGQISVPVKTNRGYELIQRVKKVPTKYKDMSSVESEIKKELGVEKFKKRFAQDANRIISSVKYDAQALEHFIERYHGVKSELPLEEKKSSIDSAQLFKAEEGRFSQFFNKDKGVILQCTKIEKSMLPELNQLRNQVVKLYEEHMANQMMKDSIDQALKDAMAMPLEQVAEKYGTKLLTAQSIYKDGKNEQSPLLKDPLVKSGLKNLSFKGALTTVIVDSAAYLIRLDQVQPVNASLFNEQKDHLQKVLFYTEMYQTKEGFIASLYRIAKLNNKIEIKNELLQTTKEV